MDRLRKVNEDSYRIQDDGSIGPMTEKKIKENDGTMVTVVCISYNHEKFIRDALDSFLMQKTDFKFKIFVGEDHGPDHTADIIREYARKYPDIVVPFIREKNMGAQRNLIDLCQHATSPYIAFCEGDDYWVDDHKLQKQVEYMEEHKNIKVCGTRTEIKAPEDWYLKDWYIAVNGKYIIPDSNPSIRKAKKLYSTAEYIDNNILQTSSYFFRWDYDLKEPEWYYKGIIGDAPILLLQLGIGEVAVLPDVTSVYRINSGSVWFDTDKETNFLRTRLDYVRYLEGLRDYALEHWDGYPVVTVENRIKREAWNYLAICERNGMTDEITAFFHDYPEAGRIVLNAFLSFYHDSQMLTGTLTWPVYKLVVRNRWYRNALRPYGKLVGAINPLRIKVKNHGKNLLNFLCYWLYSMVPKQKNLWVFSAFNKKGYLDNAMYLYEWTVAHHPEIRACWMTRDKEVYEKLKAEGKPVAFFRTKEGRNVLKHAAIAVTDHFVMSDYEPFSGFNNRTKVVQLWHGVGLKAMVRTNGNHIKNTNVNGVLFSEDILPQPEDGLGMRLVKKLKYLRHAYYRELFEKYFMLLCPGPERLATLAHTWGVPRERCFMSGHPRNIYLHTAQPSAKPKILYAPTYRWKVKDERAMVADLVSAFPVIEKMMEAIDGTFTIRLHPHTWRNYTGKIRNAMKDCPRILYDDEKDVYKTLGTYTIMISGYSSIAYDFILLDRPVIFYCPDKETYVNDDCDFNYDYDTYSPGPKTETWTDTMEEVLAYVQHPEKDSPWREKVRDAFYDMNVNDENNSERIVEEIKRRIGL